MLNSYSNGTEEQPITQLQYGIKNYKLISDWPENLISYNKAETWPWVVSVAGWPESLISYNLQ